MGRTILMAPEAPQTVLPARRGVDVVGSLLLVLGIALIGIGLALGVLALR